MAFADSDIFSSLRKSIGDKRYHMSRDRRIIASRKGAPPTFKNEEDRIKRDKRFNGYGGSGLISSIVLDSIRIGLVERKRNQSAANKFMELNAKVLCETTEDERGNFERMYHFENMILAKGKIYDPKLTVTVDLEAGNITITQEAQTFTRNNSNPKDQLYVTIFDATNEWSELHSLKPRGENGSTQIPIPEEWDKTNIHVYSFAVFHTRQKTSTSRHQYPATNNV